MTAAARLNKEDLRTIYASLGRLLPPGSLPRDPEEVVRIGAARELIGRMIVEWRAEPERGDLVFSWRVPRDQALTMNAYAHKKGWMKTELRKKLDAAVIELKGQFLLADLRGAMRRRWLRVTRFSTQRVDDLSIDVLGGKMAVDSLVRCGILWDDDEKGALREPRWEITKRGNTHVLVEVFEIVEDGTHEHDEAPPAIVRQLDPPKEGFMTRAIREAKPPLPKLPPGLFDD